jgi:hypothetical protein
LARKFRFTLLFALSATVATGSVRAAVESRQAADSLSQKVAAITDRASQRKPQPATVTVSEDELNSWFVFRSARYLPVGVTKPSIQLLGGGTLKGMATVDLESMARRRTSGSLLNPLSYISGRVPVAVTGILSAKDGMGRFDVQSSEVAGIPVPAVIVQELVSYYATSPESPDGIRLDEPFALPANIRRVDVARGHMVVVQ